MTDKQIIDICPYQGECSVSGCKRNDAGCFVRQLFEERYRAENQIVELNNMVKVKEQECEAYKMEADEGIEINAELKAENDELKEKVKKYGEINEQETKDYAELLKQLDQLKAENDELKKQLTILDDEDVVVEITVKQFEEYKKLKQTLTEIKEIAEWKNEYWSLGIADYKNMADEILQKISECEVE